uniref:Uncharacterized protein n=1 Tax=Tanacetum cinerariifolium TaxID=118510 RepID=A0A6L2N338_TANCI|nr:hypothetical protein [Tanacetum cinerariifolium]
MGSNPSQPLVFTPVDTGINKEDQQATGGLTSLGVAIKERANPRLSSGMSKFNLNKPIYLAFFIIHSESASGNDASAVSTAKVDHGNSAPNQTKSISERLETILTQPITEKRASSVARQIEEETSSTIKLEDIAKLVSHVQPSFKDLDSPEDDPVIGVDDTDEDKEDEIYAATNDKTEYTSVPKSSSPYSLLTELKELLSKFNGLTEEVKGLTKQLHELEIKLPGDLKEIPTKLEDFTNTITSLTSQVAELKTLQDFVTIEDLKDFSNTMLYTVQEIFFRRHQGLGLDDHARTFSPLLLTEVDKINLNPLKQMRVIEQLRFEGLEYTDVDIKDFEGRLSRIYGREGQSVFTSRAWRRLFEIRDLLVHKLILEFFITFRFGEAVLDLDTAKALQDLMLRLCHMLIACSIVGRSQAPENVIIADLFYIRGMDVGLVNIPYLLAWYLRRFASGRKHGA